jgi:hypothetical protein
MLTKVQHDLSKSSPTFFSCVYFIYSSLIEQYSLVNVVVLTPLTNESPHMSLCLRHVLVDKVFLKRHDKLQGNGGAFQVTNVR